MHKVKEERHDEAEIQELAAKFVEANKAKMANLSRPQASCTGMNILTFLQPDKKNVNNTSPAAGEPRPVDEESIKGRFGWSQVGKEHIPYIFRSGEHYCAVRMVEMKVLNTLLNYLHQDLYNCTNIRSYYITEAEARLFNEINYKHSDYQFGREQFTTRDLIVRYADANEFYQFLGHCYNKLISAVDADSMQRCGFIRINRESVVPYTVYNGQKYVPLFYFEGETDNLKQRADKLEGWDLAYLKFCCKVQGIRNELFAHDSCSVISLNDIKNYFPPGTLFEDYWPKKNLDSQLLVNSNSSRSHAQIAQWTRKPTAPPAPIVSHPPPSPKPATQAKAPNNNPLPHNIQVYGNYLGGGTATTTGPYLSQPRTASSASRATYVGNAGRNIRPSTSYYGAMTPAPPPLVRVSQTYHPTYGKDDCNLEVNIFENDYSQYGKKEWQASYANSQSNTGNSSGYMIMEPSYQKYPPPPLIQMNGAIARDGMNTYNVSSTQQPIINQQPAHQATRAQCTTPSGVPDDRNAATNGRMQATMRQKLIPIPEQPNNIPYKVIPKEIAEGKVVPCITMKPYQHSNASDLLVTLPDLIANFFHNMPVQSCQQVMHVLGIELYKPNTAQFRVLMETGKYQNITDTSLPLVQVRNVVDYMPQLKYMLSMPEPPAKRQRPS
ncbi:uncharacterized protein LOC109609470 isoform X2 [Aethina tumida]|uniref:uncharacterized protein LOC109609470 isoform X2 n=1 Tax=Aethina tumida TaxID=116153 RepID=UPI0021483C30|nr:uncharacterized protein LOC109609470 isoform X2 [Aethina tumida]